MTHLTIGLLGVGEMGAGLASAFVNAGHTVVSDLTGRSESSCVRALKANIEGEVSLEAVVTRADILFSVLPTQFAYDEAVRVSKLLKGIKTSLLFVEANAIAPSLAADISKLFTDNNTNFIDAGIVGTPPSGSKRPRLYVSGGNVEPLKLLDGFGIDLVDLGKKIGTASAFKMTYAAMTKGVNALLTNVMLAAEEHGFLELFLEEAQKSQTHLAQRASSNIARLPCDAARWEDEMGQIARSFDDIGLPSAFHIGAGDIMRILAASPYGSETRLTHDKTRSMMTTIQEVFLTRSVENDQGSY
jgi:3-hydroxyisobutyrate dehydrogenase-like beta-hydroxyacid dehydrogenase